MDPPGPLQRRYSFSPFPIPNFFHSSFFHSSFPIFHSLFPIFQYLNPQSHTIAGFIDIGSEMVEIWILDFHIFWGPKS